MDGNLHEEILQLLRQGKNIQAIQHYRSVTGVGLADAKKAVETIIENLPSSREFFFRRVTFLLKNGSVQRATEVFAQEMNLSHEEATENITLLQKHKIHPADSIRDEIKELLEQSRKTEAVDILMKRRGLTQFAAIEVITHIEEG